MGDLMEAMDYLFDRAEQEKALRLQAIICGPTSACPHTGRMEFRVSNVGIRETWARCRRCRDMWVVSW